MDEEEPGEPLETELSTLADDLRLGMLEALRRHEPLAILASLSLVMAAFLHTFLEAAVPFAAAASAAFLAALASSLLQQVFGRRQVPAWPFALAVVSVVAVVLGFAMLAAVVWSFSLTFPLVASIVVALLSVLMMVIAVAMSVSVWDYALRVRRADQARWSRSRAYLVASGLVSAGSAALLTVALILLPRGVTVVPGVDQGWVVAIAFLGALVPSFYVYHVHRLAAAGTKGGRAR